MTLILINHRNKWRCSCHLDRWLKVQNGLQSVAGVGVPQLIRVPQLRTLNKIFAPPTTTSEDDEDTLRLRSEEAVMRRTSPQRKTAMAVICWEWPRSSCTRSPVWKMDHCVTLLFDVIAVPRNYVEVWGGASFSQAIVLRNRKKKCFPAIFWHLLAIKNLFGRGMNDWWILTIPSRAPSPSPFTLHSMSYLHVPDQHQAIVAGWSASGKTQKKPKKSAGAILLSSGRFHPKGS